MTSDEFVKNIKPKGFYYFISPHITSLEPHYFLCIGFNYKKDPIFLCLTSQIESQQKRSNNIIIFDSVDKYKTLYKNGITKRSCINCDKIFIHKRETLKNIFDKYGIKYKNQLNDDIFTEIFSYIKRSYHIDDNVKTEMRSHL